MPLSVSLATSRTTPLCLCSGHSTRTDRSSSFTDATHTLNGLPQSTKFDGVVTKFGAPSFASSTGEGIIPGTKEEYEDEYVIGFERKLSQSIVFKARYTDRRLGRVIEDIGSQSPEGSTIIPNFNGGIANPGPGTDIAVNEQEVTYTQAQFLAANPSGNPASTANYKAPVTGCTARERYLLRRGRPLHRRQEQTGWRLLLPEPATTAGRRTRRWTAFRTAL